MDGFDFVALIEVELTKRKISKAEFYKATGISSATFSQWRNRIYAPSNAAIKKVEDYLGISVFFQAQEKPVPSEEDELSELQQKAVDMIMNMTDDQLKAFIAAAEAFLK